MGFQANNSMKNDGRPQAEISSISETQMDGCARACPDKRDGCSPLERALITLSRDSELRSKFLRKRWQGTIEGRGCSDELRATTEEFWWSRRLEIPVGRALSRLNR